MDSFHLKRVFQYRQPLFRHLDRLVARLMLQHETTVQWQGAIDPGLKEPVDGQVIKGALIIIGHGG